LEQAWPQSKVIWLWVDADGLRSVCLAGPRGDAARALLPEGSTLEWTFEAQGHFDAMNQYHARMGWPPYVSDFPDEDMRTYADKGWE
jgi:plastocyanin